MDYGIKGICAFRLFITEVVERLGLSISARYPHIWLTRPHNQCYKPDVISRQNIQAPHDTIIALASLHTLIGR